MFQVHTSVLFVLLLVVASSTPQLSANNCVFLRGDADSSGTLTISDCVAIATCLFTGGACPPNMNAVDANGDCSLDGTDASYICDFLFRGGSAPPEPYPEPGAACPECPNIQEPPECQLGSDRVVTTEAQNEGPVEPLFEWTDWDIELAAQGDDFFWHISQNLGCGSDGSFSTYGNLRWFANDNSGFTADMAHSGKVNLLFDASINASFTISGVLCPQGVFCSVEESTLEVNAVNATVRFVFVNSGPSGGVENIFLPLEVYLDYTWRLQESQQTGTQCDLISDEDTDQTVKISECILSDCAALFNSGTQQDRWFLEEFVLDDVEFHYYTPEDVLDNDEAGEGVFSPSEEINFTFDKPTFKIEQIRYTHCGDGHCD